MKRSAFGNNAGNGSEAGSALLDPAYVKYVPNRFTAGSRNLKFILAVPGLLLCRSQVLVIFNQPAMRSQQFRLGWGSTGGWHALRYHLIQESTRLSRIRQIQIM